ncbi:MAG: glycosyltransferase [Nanoarchaeota archaeon]|nr:glycosyltransferase [Nanoarchaeota archaeon]MBU1051195.1 glycosyltransferase [Nanoarchaeota archaeon]MBU1988682.1 glycosyltransferase [Nanoarchaeota archaeon]
MVDVIITSFKEPLTIGKAIDSFIQQDIKEKYKIWVIAPDEPTLNVARRYSKKHKNIKVFKDSGKGKSFALHEILPKLKSEIIVLSDGDVHVKTNCLKYLIEPFNDKKVGCVTGRPVSEESKKNIYGYWSHLLCDAGAHKARLKRFRKKQFLECSGYFWAFRNHVIKRFPLDIPEDTVISYLFREKKYKIAYAPKAIVYVTFPKNLHEFIEQKKRTAKGHEAPRKYVNMKKIPRTKSFKNELLEGYRALFYPKNLIEIFYTLLLFPVRLYIWMLVFHHTRIKKKEYQDAWERIESTK